MIEIKHHIFIPSEFVEFFKLIIGSWHSTTTGEVYNVDTTVDGVSSNFTHASGTAEVDSLSELRQLWLDSIELPEGWTKSTGTHPNFIDIDIFPPPKYQNYDAISIDTNSSGLAWRVSTIMTNNESDPFTLPEQGYINVLNSNSNMFVSYDGIQVPFEEGNYYEGGLEVSLSPTSSLMPVVVRYLHIT